MKGQKVEWHSIFVTWPFRPFDSDIFDSNSEYKKECEEILEKGGDPRRIKEMWT